VIIHFDITELIVTLRRTGIQRVERELIRHWPGPVPLHPCWLDPRFGRLCALPPAVLSLLASDLPPGGPEVEAKALAPLVARGRTLRPSSLYLLNAELFFDPTRTALYTRLASQGGNRIHWLVYDFLPWLYPQFFGVGAARSGMGFLRALRHVPNVAFISEQVRADYHTRIMRGQGVDGPVLPLGGDGLGIERQIFTSARTDFVWLGTIEPRKNANAVLRAFMRLWGEGTDARLVMIGRIESTALEEGKLLHQLRQENRFRHMCGASDATIRDRFKHARALIFPSRHEGFGLPPIEALHAGIPVIVWRGLPALHGLSSAGQIRLENTSTDAITDAVRWLLDDTNAQRMWAEAATLTVPTWRDFTLACATWVQAS
jgi:glycosyltransferase involved in cell wall biosynthesis